MDVQPQGKKVQTAYVALENAMAEDIEPILTDLFTGKTRLGPVPGGPNAAGGEIQDPEPRIIADMRTNQIILYATADDIESTVSELNRRGVEFSQGIEDHGYGLVTYFRVPGAFKVQLYQPRYKK